MTQLHRPAAAVVALALTVTACGSAEKKEKEKEPDSLQDQIKVSGEVGKGDKVGADAIAILHLTLANGRTGETAVSTYDEGQRPFEAMLGDRLFPSLVQALTGKPADSRVVGASTSDDAYGQRSSW